MTGTVTGTVTVTETGTGAEMQKGTHRLCLQHISDRVNRNRETDTER